MRLREFKYLEKSHTNCVQSSVMLVDVCQPALWGQGKVLIVFADFHDVNSTINVFQATKVMSLEHRVVCAPLHFVS